TWSSASALQEPYCRAISTPAPRLTPLTHPVSRKIRLPDDPTAASASPPRKLPTMRESTALYSCWNRLLKKIGTANSSIPRFTLPRVSETSFSATGTSTPRSDRISSSILRAAPQNVNMGRRRRPGTAKKLVDCGKTLYNIPCIHEKRGDMGHEYPVARPHQAVPGPRQKSPGGGHGGAGPDL